MRNVHVLSTLGDLGDIQDAALSLLWGQEPQVSLECFYLFGNWSSTHGAQSERRESSLPKYLSASVGLRVGTMRKSVKGQLEI